jgi:serine/threonine protein kinase
MTSQPPRQNQDDDTTRIAPETKAPAAQHKKQQSQFTKNFRIEGVIGEGGVGRVYLAYDKIIGRQVAVKEILDYSPGKNSELIYSFIHEAKITGKLEHPGIIPIYKIGNRLPNGPYYVMKHIKGITMEDQFRSFAENSDDDHFKQRIKLLDPLIDVCEALAYAHSKGVIHRDIKPDNIISGKFGETIIIDWGLAQVIDDDNTQFYNKVKNHQQRTFSDLQSTSTVGTPRYMAPEQMTGHACKASDVYSLGVILFRIITGRFPYNGSADDIEKQLGNDKPTPSPFKFSPSAPAELVAICEKATAKSAAHRFADANELLNQLNDYRSGRMINIYHYSKRELIRRFFSRNKLLVSMLSLLFVAIITGTGFALHYAYQMNLAKNEAVQALGVITTFVERAQKQANLITSTIRTSAGALKADLVQSANTLSQLNQSDIARENLILSQLQDEYPRFESFSITHAKSLSAELSLGWKTDAQKYDAPIVKIQDSRLEIIFRTPIKKEDHIERYLEAKMYPEKVIPALFPIAPVSASNPRDIWIIRNDGQIIYDKNINYLGKNLFTDLRNKLTPSLVSFAQLTFKDDEGVGYYTFTDEDKKIEKVASWDSIQFSETERWIIIVTYPYLIQKASSSDLKRSF